MILQTKAAIVVFFFYIYNYVKVVTFWFRISNSPEKNVKIVQLDTKPRVRITTHIFVSEFSMTIIISSVY
jgi:hypothetical protein